MKLGWNIRIKKIKPRKIQENLRGKKTKKKIKYGNPFEQVNDLKKTKKISDSIKVKRNKTEEHKERWESLLSKKKKNSVTWNQLYQKSQERKEAGKRDADLRFSSLLLISPTNFTSLSAFNYKFYTIPWLAKHN